MVTVNKTKLFLGSVGPTLLKRLLAGLGLSTAAPILAKAPEVPTIDKPVTETGGGNSETSADSDGSGENASIILRGTSAFTTTAPDTTGPAGLDRHEAFFMWEIGSWGKPLPNPGRVFPVYVTRMEG